MGIDVTENDDPSSALDDKTFWTMVLFGSGMFFLVCCVCCCRRYKRQRRQLNANDSRRPLNTNAPRRQLNNHEPRRGRRRGRNARRKWRRNRNRNLGQQPILDDAASVHESTPPHLLDSEPLWRDQHVVHFPPLTAQVPFQSGHYPHHQFASQQHQWPQQQLPQYQMAPHGAPQFPYDADFNDPAPPYASLQPPSSAFGNNPGALVQPGIMVFPEPPPPYDTLPSQQNDKEQK